MLLAQYSPASGESSTKATSASGRSQAIVKTDTAASSAQIRYLRRRDAFQLLQYLLHSRSPYLPGESVRRGLRRNDGRKIPTIPAIIHVGLKY